MSTSTAAGSLPVPTARFVGRVAELREVKLLLAGTRLLTVTGAGGVGKTELAVQLGHAVRRLYPHGVAFADLTNVQDMAMLETVLADAAGIRNQSTRPALQSVVEHFRGRHALLVLDNCEHIADQVSELISVLLDAAPQLRIVATSRIAPLRVAGERLYQVSPLAVPGADHASLSLVHLLACESVQLLVDRAAGSLPGFTVTEDNRRDMVRLVQRLDGLPLAITLAAARLRTLTVAQLVERLDRAFVVLTDATQAATPHHRTLEAVIDWSYRLCSPGERLVWERCSVFASGFDLDAAEAVCADPADLDQDELLNIVDGLIQKSILVVDRTGGVARYRLMETMRQYAAGKLAERGETDVVKARHLAYYHHLAERASTHWYADGHREVAWLERIDAEMPNLRAAMHHAAAEGGAAAIAGLGVAAHLCALRIWFYRGPIVEGYLWLRRLLDAAPPSTPVDLRVNALAGAAWIAVCVGNRSRATAMLAECVELAPEHPMVLFVDGALRMVLEGDPTSPATFAAARAGLIEAGMPGQAHMACLFQAMASALFGDLVGAREASNILFDEARSWSAAWSVSWARWVVGLTDLRHGRVGRAVALFRESLAEQRRLDERWGSVWSVHGLAWALSQQGDRETTLLATRLLGVTKTLRVITGLQFADMLPHHAMHTEVERRCLHRLGAAVYREAFESGAALSVEQGHALALGEAPPRPPTDPWASAGVTKREREVAMLAADGLSNKEIGERLVIGSRTVETHIGNVLPKLGLRKRAQLAKWVADNN